ncbi:hypothetical protein BJ166DRAFT_537998 [Pestalotiopsis sp. NC0098]|nr:hypothetical protein BJ166DRAFT_537998 [Pestalotiopsis sp. NC0098]
MLADAYCDPMTDFKAKQPNAESAFDDVAFTHEASIYARPVKKLTKFPQGGPRINHGNNIISTSAQLECWWLWEIGAIVLSIGCITSIVGVLVHIDNMTVEQWRFTIAPNSLIAIMTTVSKTAMMVPIASCISQAKWAYFLAKGRPYKDLETFDSASRGPWGSLYFLSQMRTQALTASGLAIVTLAALGFEPAAQQILQVSTREMLIYPPPLIPIALEYSSRSVDFISSPGKGYGLPVPSDVLHILSNIIGSVSGNSPLLDAYFPPQSLECNWPPFITLGVCSVARNVTSVIAPVCSFSDIARDDYFHEEGYQNFTCQFDFAEIRNASLVGSTAVVSPASMTNQSPQPLVLDGTTEKEQYGWYEWASFKYLASVGSIGLDQGGLNLDLVRYAIDPEEVRTVPGYGTNYQIPPTANSLSLWEAWNVQWYWCSYSYTDVVAVPSGVKSFNVTSERLYRDPDNSNIYTHAYQVNGSNIKYEIDSRNPSEVALFKYLAKALTNDLQQSADYEDDLLHFGRYLYGADINQFAQNLADTLSLLVRQNTSGDNLLAGACRGSAMGTVAYYHVRAGWLALPSIEVLLTTVMLIVVILRSRSHPLLKSSQLALVLYGREGRGKEFTFTESESNATTLEDTIGNLKVRLDRNETGRVGFIHEVPDDIGNKGDSHRTPSE